MSVTYTCDSQGERIPTETDAGEEEEGLSLLRCEDQQEEASGYTGKWGVDSERDPPSPSRSGGKKNRNRWIVEWTHSCSSCLHTRGHRKTTLLAGVGDVKRKIPRLTQMDRRLFSSHRT